MAKLRIGFGSDFTLDSSEVGIGTTNPTAKLQVVDTLKGDFNITGVSTLRVYGGFAAQKQNVTKDSSIGFSTTGIGTFTQPNERETGFLSLVGEYNTVSEDLIVDEGKIFEISTTNITATTTLGTQEVYAPDDSVVSVGTLESVSIQSHFNVPDGGINDRPDQPVEGMVRFNDDLNTLEFYNGIEWRQFTVSGASGRGVIMGTGGGTQTIEYITIATLGNSSYFGDATFAGGYRSGSSSSTRGIYAMGYQAPTSVNNIEYVTLASQGNGIDFGDATQARYGAMSLSSQTRSVIAGGYNTSPLASYVTTIDYIQIDTLGNALDFGDLPKVKAFSNGCSSPTRGIYGGIHFGSADAAEKSIVSVTIASKGDAINFGNLTERREVSSAAVSNGTRAVFAGGVRRSETGVSGGLSNRIDYVTISSFGNATSFGDLTLSVWHMCSVQSLTRGVFAGGAAPAGVNNIQYITISSTGNAQDFGDLSKAGRTHNNGASDSHGGLGGF